ncbi:hypothetical protein [Synechococcus sp. UW140]
MGTVIYPLVVSVATAIAKLTQARKWPLCKSAIFLIGTGTTAGFS